jgi:parallel beta-helix repeat protein
MKSTLLALFVASLILPPSSFLLAQGPLTPPGAPAPTMKTLDQLDAKLEKRTPISSLPFSITQSGSYYLTGNLTAPLGGNGIGITASHVTLDLGGFALVGNGAPGISGIGTAAGVTNIVIRNGTVRNWPGAGIIVGNTSVSNVRVEGIRSLGNGAAGIAVGTESVVIDCVAIGNASDGIRAEDRSVVLRCIARDNTNSGMGIEVGDRSVVRECTATGNAFHGISAELSCEVSDCTASGNVQFGIEVGNGSSVRACVADANTTAGFRLGASVSVENCSATNTTGGPGFDGNNDNRISGSTARANAGNGFTVFANAVLQGCTAHSNAGNGLVAGSGSVIAECAAGFNTGASGIIGGAGSVVSRCAVDSHTGSVATSQGISGGIGSQILDCAVSVTRTTFATPTSASAAGIVVASSSTVRGCTLRDNAGDGIRATVLCHLVGNTCDLAGSTASGDGAGIHVTGTRNRIDGNHVTGSDRGIDVDSTSNSILRNTASGNTVNYDIVANNSVGAIVNPANSAAIAGNGALASSLGTTDPWANLSE